MVTTIHPKYEHGHDWLKVMVIARLRLRVSGRSEPHVI